MTQPVKYLTIVNNIVRLYQQEIISFLKKSPPEYIQIFKSKFSPQFKKLQEVQVHKSIDKDKTSQVCDIMNNYLISEERVKKTSQSERYSIRSSLRTQDGHRMRFTGGLKKSINVPKESQISETHELEDIIKSYKIEQGIEPRMRMKWKSIDYQQSDKKRQSNQAYTIGDNNINLLSFTIPEIQNSIKRLSLQSNNRQRSPQQIFSNYRTIDTRNQGRKKYISRLI